MGTRLHRFIPQDIYYVPDSKAAEVALAGLRT